MKIKPAISMLLSVGGLLLVNKTEATLIHGFKCVDGEIEVIGLGEVQSENKQLELQVQAFMQSMNEPEKPHDVLILCDVNRGQAEHRALYHKTFMTQALKALKRNKRNPLDIFNIRLKDIDIRSQNSEKLHDFLRVLPTQKRMRLENKKPDTGHHFRRLLAFDLWTQSDNVCAFISSDVCKKEIVELYEKLRAVFLHHRDAMPQEIQTMFSGWFKRLRESYGIFCKFIPKQFKTPHDIVKFLDVILVDDEAYETFLKAAHGLTGDIEDCALALILWDEIIRHKPGKKLRIVVLNRVSRITNLQLFGENILKMRCVQVCGMPEVAKPLSQEQVENLLSFCAVCGASCTIDYKSVWRRSLDERFYYCSKECYYQNEHDLAELTTLIKKLNLTRVARERDFYRPELAMLGEREAAA